MNKINMIPISLAYMGYFAVSETKLFKFNRQALVFGSAEEFLNLSGNTVYCSYLNYVKTFEFLPEGDTMLMMSTVSCYNGVLTLFRTLIKCQVSLFALIMTTVLNYWHGELFGGNITPHGHFGAFVDTSMVQKQEISLHRRQGPIVLHSQYHVC